MQEEKIFIDADDGDEKSGNKEKKTIRVLVFGLGGESYCADIRNIKSVVRIDSVTRVPNMPEFVIGVMNLRGEIISVLDIRSLFGLPQKKRTPRGRVIVTEAWGSQVGIIADDVRQAIDVGESSIQPPLATISGKLASYTKGEIQTKDEIIIMLDLDRVLRSEEIGRIKKGE
ncbi:MAG: chemotaxis protein CheW [Candidatus Omnitrophica bacterium]|nr:chemotaxis protein CheW [Candidatus Omnitrophota bacterium]